MVVPLTALFTALGLEWVSWGQGRFNWGPRLGSILLLVFGQVAFKGTVVGGWLKTAIDWAAHWLGVGATWLLGSTAGDAVSYLVHWLPAALLAAYWLAALLPGQVFKERMTWRLAWAGMLIPTFVGAIPGPVGHFFDMVIGVLADVGAAFITMLFHVGG